MASESSTTNKEEENGLSIDGAKKEAARLFEQIDARKGAARLFEQIDENGDGYISVDEGRRYARRQVEADGFWPGVVTGASVTMLLCCVFARR
eukprot:TRINITY_DN4183_c0_g1_i2.p1 TRINITY_DN4183_c0_g1~~TRINITY_DN4183_c0_g1_i2.p1  ORF type:complete len:106 (-),score=21.89 TRINITY_DN4183_c0_g1_i2:58-336(-)